MNFWKVKYSVGWSDDDVVVDGKFVFIIESEVINSCNYRFSIFVVCEWDNVFFLVKFFVIGGVFKRFLLFM